MNLYMWCMYCFLAVKMVSKNDVKAVLYEIESVLSVFLTAVGSLIVLLACSVVLHLVVGGRNRFRGAAFVLTLSLQTKESADKKALPESGH